MPIYDFICQACGSEFEKLVSFSDQNAVVCPSCQSTEVQRQMGLPAIHFKGSGWYITDSKDSKNGSSTPAESTSSTNGDKSAKSEESSSGSTDSKGANESPGKQDASGESKKATVT